MNLGKFIVMVKSFQLTSQLKTASRNYYWLLLSYRLTMATKSTAVTRDYGKRTAIVTGAARGMWVKHILPSSSRNWQSISGKAIAIRLAEDGFDVCINDLASSQDDINTVFNPPHCSFEARYNRWWAHQLDRLWNQSSRKKFLRPWSWRLQALRSWATSLVRCHWTRATGCICCKCRNSSSQGFTWPNRRWCTTHVRSKRLWGFQLLQSCCQTNA